MILYLVIPCYNEEEMLPVAAPVIKSKLCQLIDEGKISPKSRAVFIDDGSKDNTRNILTKMTKDCELFGSVKLARNVGHQRALLAGLMSVKEHCDAAVSMDADLQDDINAIDGFIEKYYENCDIVYGVRKQRDSDTAFKRNTAQGFYKLMNVLGVESVYNHADYRLMSKRALFALSEYKEANLFLRGIIPLIGFRTDYVYYDRGQRAAGESKYPLKKMIHLAIDGITSFSTKPLRIISGLGIVIALMSFLGLIYALISKLTGAVSGWTAMISAIFMLGGIQLLCIGICGEYIGKIYNEVKKRPRYLIDEIELNQSDD